MKLFISMFHNLQNIFVYQQGLFLLLVFMFILGQVMLSQNQVGPAGLGKGLGEGPEGLEIVLPPYLRKTRIKEGGGGVMSAPRANMRLHHLGKVKIKRYPYG